MTLLESLRSSPALGLVALLMFGAGVVAGACQLANPNHCQNIAIDPNAWCGAVYPDEPFCSPCEADNNGCVADEPNQTDCPAYTVPASETGTDTDTGTDSGDDTDTSGTETG
jgi:hypothetical protein